MRQAPKSREESLENLLGDHKLVPDQDLTKADASALAARHKLAPEGHEPHR